MLEAIDGKRSSVEDVKLISLPRIDIESGSITAINSRAEIEFDIKRLYYLYDLPNRSDRGAHAHKELFQLIVAASGSFEVEMDDSKKKKTFILRQPDEGLLIPPGLWRDLRRFSGGAICLVLASENYDENDYIRNLNDFHEYKN